MRLDVTKSPYGPLHAIAAGAVLLFVAVAPVVFKLGFGVFWRMFLYGVKMPSDAKSIAEMLASTVLVFGGTALLVWASTLFAHREEVDSGDGISARERKEGLLFALKATPPITIATLVVCLACSAAIEKLAGVKLADQPLIDFLRGGGSLAAKSIVALLVIVEAPLVEEPLFRGIVFRGFARSMPMWCAMVLSGFVFALVHVNAATFVPLWFLGVMFAWLYMRTGTILAPMLVHFLFNLVNFCSVLILPAE